MVQIPGGKFKMGTDSSEAMQNERPAHDVTVAAFQLDVAPVSVAAYRECVNASACEEAVGRGFGGGSGYTGCNWEATDGSKDNYPINCRTFADAPMVVGERYTSARWARMQPPGRASGGSKTWSGTSTSGHPAVNPTTTTSRAGTVGTCFAG
jgi:formylglycine-generating enzyme required for sulfatase activity